MRVGTKIKFDGERQRYTVTACNERFAIMWKPFNARKTYLYTITDLERGVRGPCNLIFGPPENMSTLSGAVSALEMIERGEMAVSRRRYVSLTHADIARLTSQEPS
jgi:hypothetical protein